MSFLKKWSSGEFGDVRAKSTYVYVPPTVEQYREKFAVECELAADDIEQGKVQRKLWFKRFSDGSYVISLRGGIVALEVAEKQSCTYVPNLPRAIEFLREAAAAGRKGEFDDLLAQARRRMTGRTKVTQG